MQRNSLITQVGVYDRWILLSALALMAIGLLMVASASMVISDQQYHYPFHYVTRQAFYLGFGLLLIWLTTSVPVRSWQAISGYLLIFALLLLMLVLIPGIGKVVNGSRRWLSAGFITLQPSEIIKLAGVLYLASYLTRYQKAVRTDLLAFAKPMVLLSLIAVLLLLEPDFGALSVVTITFLALLYVSGVRLWPFLLLFVMVTGAMALLAVVSPYRLARITTFLNPWSNPYGSGYQLTQSLIAFGRGGLWGVGLGNSVQKLFYLPEAHTDFLFAVLAEEFGLAGQLLLVGLFILLVARTMRIGYIAWRNERLFAAYTAFGLGLWLGLQALINIGVNAGILPTKGLTLPLMSYGGSSLLINCMVIGIILRIAYENTSASVVRRRVVASA